MALLLQGNETSSNNNCEVKSAEKSAGVLLLLALRWMRVLVVAAWVDAASMTRHVDTRRDRFDLRICRSSFQLDCVMGVLGGDSGVFPFLSPSIYIYPTA